MWMVGWMAEPKVLSWVELLAAYSAACWANCSVAWMVALTEACWVAWMVVPMECQWVEKMGRLMAEQRAVWKVDWTAV